MTGKMIRPAGNRGSNRSSHRRAGGFRSGHLPDVAAPRRAAAGKCRNCAHVPPNHRTGPAPGWTRFRPAALWSQRRHSGIGIIQEQLQRGRVRLDRQPLHPRVDHPPSSSVVVPPDGCGANKSLTDMAVTLPNKPKSNHMKHLFCNFASGPVSLGNPEMFCKCSQNAMKNRLTWPPAFPLSISVALVYLSRRAMADRGAKLGLAGRHPGMCRIRPSNTGDPDVDHCRRQKKPPSSNSRAPKVDTGSPEVQVAVLTQAHFQPGPSIFKTHKKDNHSRRGLLKLVATRRKLLDYLRGKDEARYRVLISKLGIRRNQPRPDHAAPAYGGRFAFQCRRSNPPRKNVGRQIGIIRAGIPGHRRGTTYRPSSSSRIATWSPQSEWGGLGRYRDGFARITVAKRRTMARSSATISCRLGV